MGEQVGDNGLHPDPFPSSEYMAQLERQLQFYTEAARRLGNDGSRVSQTRAGQALGDQGRQRLLTNHLLAPQEAAKEALYRRNLVESEVSSLAIGGGGWAAVALSPSLTPAASPSAAAAPQVRS